MYRNILYQMKGQTIECITYFRKYFSHRVVRRWKYALDQRVAEASTLCLKKVHPYDFHDNNVI